MSDCIAFRVKKPASIRGFSFNLATGNESGSHRKIDHGYPNRDEHFIEDLGLDSDQFNISGYIDQIDAQGDKIRRLRNALKDKGACSFYHPILDEMFTVEIDTWSIDTSKEQIGRIDFSFTCIKVLTNPFALSIQASLSFKAALQSSDTAFNDALKSFQVRFT